MSEQKVTIEKMLERIDQALAPKQTGDITWYPSEEDRRLLGAIRTLIEKVRGWKERITRIDDDKNDDGLAELMAVREVIIIAKEIRDFGKEV